MTVCNRCGKENQDHYKFCLGCGAELTAPKPAAGGGGDMGMMKTMMADPGQSPLAGAPLGGARGPSGAMPGQAPMRPTGGPVHELLDQGGQGAEVDRPLRQTPQAEPAQEDQRRHGCAEPCQNAVSPATHTPRR